MKNDLIDAVKTARSIHDGNYSSLRGKSFVISGNIKKKGRVHPGVKTVKKSRIDKLEGRMDRFESRMDRFESRMGRFESRMGRTEELIAKLIKKIDNLGNDLRNEMNAGFKQVNTRLDYIVKANNLKDLSNNK